MKLGLFLCVFVLIINVIQDTYSKWWFVSQLGSSVASNGIHCQNIPGLVRRQRKLCEKYPTIMLVVADGASLAIRECQHQLQSSLWNCTVIPRDASVFGTKESAFVYAINSAAVVYSLAKSCTSGKLKNCACDLTKNGRHKDRNGWFTWGGCSDNLKFATKFARKFIDAPDKRQRDIRALSNLHNNRVGRKSIRKTTQLQCKCHGVSGSCTTRTCWISLSPFRASSFWLQTRYKQAVSVCANPDGHGMVVRRSQNLPRKQDLVYLEKSPDYCQLNSETGLPGTGGRECNISSLGMDGCGSLCCGRGYYSEKRLVKNQCDCNFFWCCRVTCQTCEIEKEMHFCKSS